MNREKKSLPLIFHPTNYIFVDDDTSLLDAVAMNMDTNIPYVLEHQGPEALDYILAHTYPKTATSSIITENEDFFSYDSTKESFNVDFGELLKDLDKPDRFKKIVVAVIDRVMPDIDGLELCRKLRKTDGCIKLLLLTGNTQSSEAVEAFNDGIIDRFMTKDQTATSDKLMLAVKELAYEAFQELSAELCSILHKNTAILSNERFQQEFNKVVNEKAIVEYYLVDSRGSYFMADRLGKTYMFLVRTEEDFQEFFEMASNSGAPKHVLQAIRDRQQMPYTGMNKSHLKLEGDVWEECMVPARKVPGQEIFYAMIETPDKTVFSLRDYLGQVWPQP